MRELMSKLFERLPDWSVYIFRSADLASRIRFVLQLFMAFKALFSQRKDPRHFVRLYLSSNSHLYKALSDFVDFCLLNLHSVP